MNAAVLLIPFFLVRFGLLARFGREAMIRAARFAPLYDAEQAAYWIYQLCTVVILLSLFWLKINVGHFCALCLGLLLYLPGLCLCGASVVAFSTPDRQGLVTNGVYRWSRHPMYLSYLLIFLGMAALTRSLMLVFLILPFQLSARWIVRSEERWCLLEFGDTYRQYMERVRRWI